MKLLRRIRTHLERNEVWFRVIEVLLLVFTLAATIFIAIDITESQLRIEKSLADPIVSCEIDYNEDESQINRIDILVEQNPAKELDISFKPMYSLSIFHFDGYESENNWMASFPKNSLLLPISTFKNEDIKTKNYRTNFGKIESLYPLEISKKYMDVFENNNMDFSKLSGEFTISKVELVYFIDISYTDVLGNENNKVYFCKPNYSKTFENEYGISVANDLTNFCLIDEYDELFTLYKKVLESKCVTYDFLEIYDENKISELKKTVEEAAKNKQFYTISN